MENKLAAAILSLALLVAGWLVHTTPQAKFGAATSGLPGRIATTSISIIAAGGVNTLIATSSCVARIVSTQAASGVYLTMSDYAGQSPSGTGNLGFWQGASTTVAYDSGVYGCGLVKAYSFGAQVLTLSDVQ